ncbi:MAG: DapH/DapD/GlmU-related protein [Bacilli bacterium]|nr:DapH/DapD/GlmU-related protein [Bacilli bacterium]
MKEIKRNKLFSLNESITGKYLKNFNYPYEALPHIKEFILEIINSLDKEEYKIDKNIAIAKNATIHPSAVILGPAIIGKNTNIRVNAFIRENVIIGDNCVIGNSCEFKNTIIFNSSQIPHFNYVADSILGYKAHLGAGVITSNLKADQTNVTIKYNNKKNDTGLRKFGALIGDNAEIGCNTVLNPGTIIGRNSTVYPLSSVRGYVPENHIYKNEEEIIQKN